MQKSVIMGLPQMLPFSFRIVQSPPCVRRVTYNDIFFNDNL